MPLHGNQVNEFCIRNYNADDGRLESLVIAIQIVLAGISHLPPIDVQLQAMQNYITDAFELNEALRNHSLMLENLISRLSLLLAVDST